MRPRRERSKSREIFRSLIVNFIRLAIGVDHRLLRIKEWDSNKEPRKLVIRFFLNENSHLCKIDFVAVSVEDSNVGIFVQRTKKNLHEPTCEQQS